MNLSTKYVLRYRMVLFDKNNSADSFCTIDIEAGAALWAVSKGCRASGLLLPYVTSWCLVPTIALRATPCYVASGDAATSKSDQQIECEGSGLMTSASQRQGGVA